MTYLGAKRVTASYRSFKWQIQVDSRTLGVTFVGQNSCTENWDVGREGLHINQNGVRRLSQLYSRACGFSSRGQNLNELLAEY
jgi:hypothetical protein